MTDLFNNAIYPKTTADMIVVNQTGGGIESLQTRLTNTPTLVDGKIPASQLPSQGIRQWAASIIYTANEDVVTYADLLWICNTTHTSSSTFDVSKWTSIANNVAPYKTGYEYIAQLDYCSYNGILYLCTTSHTSTSTFDESKWVIISGGSRINSQHIAGSSSTVNTINLVGDPCLDVNCMFVMVEHTVIPPSTYSLNSAGTVLTFTTPVDAGFDIDLRWFSGNTNIFNAAAKLDLTNSPYTTNRILEIPQDIKLELSNGTLTLKAGTKVYVPNGFESDGTTPKFDVVTTASDISLDYGADRKNCFVVVDEADRLQWAPFEQVGSGTSPTTEGIYYNTSTNTITSPAGWFSEKTSLPIALITENSGAGIGGGVKSIDQIFNGFGYIGSTVFVLPGVKLEIPNGRNADGSFINNIATISTVNFNTTNQNGLCQFVCTDTGSIALGANYVYDDTKNLLKRLSDGAYYSRFILADVLYKGGKITQFTPRNIDSVANSNMSNISNAGRSFIAGMGMPSTRYEDWTLGATAASYFAPANGYIYLDKKGNSGTYLSAEVYHGNTLKYRAVDFSSTANQTLILKLEVTSGDYAVIYYNAAGTTSRFCFIYAEGEV